MPAPGLSTKENEVTKEQIDLLRLAAEDAAGGPPGAEQVDALIALVDALEAELATRQPTEDDRVLEIAHELARHYPFDVSAALKITQTASRAAVPDAATELHPLPVNGCDEQAHDTLNRNLNRVVENNTGLVNALEVMKDKRDAALAAVERVRAMHPKKPARYYGSDLNPSREFDCGGCGEGRAWPCPTVKALDRALEPEWQWGVRDDHGVRHLHSEDRARIDAARERTDLNAEVVRRRPAGPWLPAEGESKP